MYNKSEGTDLQWYLNHFRTCPPSKRNALYHVVIRKDVYYVGDLFIWSETPHGTAFWRSVARREYHEQEGLAILSVIFNQLKEEGVMSGWT